MRAEVAAGGAVRVVTRQLQRGVGDFKFAELALARDLLGDVAIAIAGGEIHLPIGAIGIGAQRLLDDAHGFDKLAPIHHCQETQAADAVADGHLVGGLLLVLGLHHLFDRQIAVGQPLLQPVQRHRERRTAALQSPHQFGYERFGHRRLGARHVRDHQHDTFGVSLGGCDQTIGPLMGHVAIAAIGNHACTDASEILDQRQSQHDRDSPQLADLQRAEGLVGADEAAQAFAIDAAIAV